MSLWLSGIGVSRGIAIGQVHRIQSADLDIPEYTLEPGAVEAEVTRFTEALKLAQAQLRQIRDHLPGGARADIAAFIETHLLMLEDRALSEAVVALIRERRCNAEWALRIQRDALVSVFEQMEDAYLKSRRDDVEHVVSGIQRILLKQDKPFAARTEKHSQATVIVADDITPADIILLHQQGVAAFISEHGGPLSHTAILVRSLGIPAVFGLHHARRMVVDGETIIVDGDNGHAIAGPDAEALAWYEKRQQLNQDYRRQLDKLKSEPAITQDDRSIRLMANVELPEDSLAAHDSGAVGVGLFRTEFLYMNRERMPDEEEQLAAYRRVLETARGPVTIRTLDLGADKQVDSGRSQGPAAANPALGLRAIRLCLKEQDMFRVQLRALLRASVSGEMRIMLPMISNLQELRQARHLIEETKDELRRQKLAYNDKVQVGAMIEVPAAALAAPLLARHADFFSIGTNDLIQYTLAIDRVDDEVNYLYDPLHPAVLRLIQITIEAGARAGIPVAMCGEMASDPRYTRLLLGLGLTEFSMYPGSLLEIKRIIRHSDTRALRGTVQRLLACTDSAELHELIEQLAAPVLH
ncbi:MAG: phosphoenolpyruvate--protein phosphotransferase [Nevskiales bacterium]